MSPTARTLAHLRELGFVAGVVERRVPGKPQITIDWGGWMDILACREGVGILGVQATTGPNHAARAEKLRREPRLAAWLAAGGRAEVWSWALQGGRGARKLWTLRREEVRP